MYTSQHATTEQKPYEQSVNHIMGGKFVTKMKEKNRVFELFGRYLRVFSSDVVNIYLDIMFTYKMESNLPSFATSMFLTSHLSEEEWKVYRKRRYGPLVGRIRIRLVGDLFYSKKLIGPAQSTRDYNKLRPIQVARLKRTHKLCVGCKQQTLPAARNSCEFCRSIHATRGSMAIDAGCKTKREVDSFS